MKPAILYAAKSTEDVHDSLPTQLEDCRTLAEREGWEVLGEHQDEAFSAYHGNRGPGLEQAKQAAVAAAAEHGECVLVAQDSDRFARGAGDKPGAADHLGEIFFAMKRQGVVLWTARRGHLDTVRAVLDGDRATEESARKSTAVAKGMKRRAERGQWVGGRPPFGYQHRDRHPESGKPTGPLVVVEAEAEIVRRIFRDYIEGGSQRAIVRALNADGVPTRHGGPWRQSAIVRVLSSAVYLGRVTCKGEVLEGVHEALIDDRTWRKAEDIRKLQHQTGGAKPQGKHLLANGVLRCSCGAAMLPRKARPGVERERYVCSGRIEDPASCSQPSIRRELVDGPLFEALLTGYIDIEDTRKRIAERVGNELALASEAHNHAQADALHLETRLLEIERDYLDGRIEPEEWRDLKGKLAVALEAAHEREQEAGERVHGMKLAGGLGDAEQILLDHLAALKQAAATTAGNAPDLDGLRRVIRMMFESIELVPQIHGAGVVTFPSGNTDGGVIPTHDGPDATFEDGETRYWLLPRLRSGFVELDDGVNRPVGQAIPVPTAHITDPDTFLARYCWW